MNLRTGSVVFICVGAVNDWARYLFTRRLQRDLYV